MDVSAHLTATRRIICDHASLPRRTIMSTTLSHALRRTLAFAAAVALFPACAEHAPVAPEQQPGLRTRGANHEREIATREAIIALRRATGRYHRLEVALNDGFVLLHDCEVRPGEGPVGTVYVNLERLVDGVVDPNSPDALVYEPRPNGRPRLVAAEFAIPYALWTKQEPPAFLGHEFQREDEFGVFGLHVWVWQKNPRGLFEEANPRISCGPMT
jgi:hypothetical protein